MEIGNYFFVALLFKQYIGRNQGCNWKKNSVGDLGTDIFMFKLYFYFYWKIQNVIDIINLQINKLIINMKIFFFQIYVVYTVYTLIFLVSKWNKESIEFLMCAFFLFINLFVCNYFFGIINI